jgi:hypothetical protein
MIRIASSHRSPALAKRLGMRTIYLQAQSQDGVPRAAIKEVGFVANDEIIELQRDLPTAEGKTP